MSTKFYATLLVTILLTGIATPPLLADNSVPIVYYMISLNCLWQVLSLIKGLSAIFSLWATR